MVTDEDSDSFESRKEKKITIQQSKDADELIRLAKLIGLEDVTQWTTVDNVQLFLDAGQMVAFTALSQESGKTPKQCGIIIAGLEEEQRLWIELLVVAQEYRQTSIGRDLMNRLEQFGKDKGFRALFVDLDDDNKPAMQFYLAIGFQNAGIIRKYYYNEKNAIVLLKNL